MDVLVLAKMEQIRRGYEALLEMKGYNVFKANENIAARPLNIIVDMGDDLMYAAKKLPDSLFNKVVFVVSPGWKGEIPVLSAEVHIIHTPTAEKLLGTLEMKSGSVS